MARAMVLVIGMFFIYLPALGCSFERLPVKDEGALFGKARALAASGPSYVTFIGEVVDVIRIADTNSSDKQFEGLLIKVIHDIYTPTPPASHFEVIPLATGADCVSYGIASLGDMYPVHSQVRVMASGATIYKKDSGADQVPRLEVSSLDGGSIVFNPSGSVNSSAFDSVYDYRSFTRSVAITVDEVRGLSAKIELYRFEKQKDLARLLRAKSDAERLKVMERLVYYPEIFDLPYHTLAEAFLKQGKKRRFLEAKWDERKRLLVRLDRAK